jgi:hypothetical protein
MKRFGVLIDTLSLLQAAPVLEYCSVTFLILHDSALLPTSTLHESDHTHVGNHHVSFRHILFYLLTIPQHFEYNVVQ